MKRSKKYLSTLLALGMTASILSACGTKKVVNAPTTDPLKDKMEISVALWDIEKGVAGGTTDTPLQNLYNKLNFTIKPMNVTWDDWASKVSLWSASGQLPDVFAANVIGSPQLEGWEKGGVIKQIPSDLSKYPNLEKVMKQPDIKALEVDGKRFILPRLTYSNVDKWELDRAILYRWDLAQQAGITKEPQTFDEFFSMMKAIQTKDPEKKKVIGLTAISSGYLEYIMTPYNSLFADDGSGSMYNWIKEDGKYIPSLFSKNNVEGFNMIKKVYESGNIDRDFALLKGNEGKDKFYSGRAAALAASANPGHLYQDNANWMKNYPDKKLADSIKVFNMPASSDGVRYHYTLPAYWSESYISGKVDDVKLDRILRVYDYMLSDDAIKEFNYGIKDVDYTMNGDVLTVTTPDIKKKYPSTGVISSLATWYDIQSTTRKVISPLDPSIDNFSKSYYDWYDKNTKRSAINFNVNSISTPARSKLVIKNQDEFTKIILSKDDVKTTFEGITSDYKAKGLDQAITEVNDKAKAMGLK